MKAILRFLRLAILFCVLSTAALLSASAEQTVDQKYIEKYITEGLYLRLESIDLSGLSCTEGELFRIVDVIMKTEPELYYVGESFYYTTDKRGFVKQITPVYLYSKQESKNAKIYCDGEIEKILFSVDASMTDFEKALVLHEYMCENFEYDKSLENHTMLELLRDGRGTCQALTLTYMELLERVGIESSYAYSNQIMHMWNVIRLDGEWYHVDITWDMAELGVLHKNFLLTDSEIAANGHTGAVVANGERCDSDKYIGASFREATYKYARFEDGFVCVDNVSRGVYFDRLDGSERVLVYRIDELWKKGEGRYYANSFSSPLHAGNKLYFNTKNCIMQIDGSFNVSAVASFDFDAFGITESEVGLACYLDRREESVRKIVLDKSMDADGDGSVTVLDIAATSLHILDNGAFIYKYNVDVNCDRLLNVTDLRLMENYVLNPAD